MIDKERYDRHIRLDKIGLNGQILLSKAKVLVIGAGGLGAPVLQYLAAAGIGTIGIIDDDHVSLSNLQRQVIYSIDHIGKNKAVTAKDILLKLNDTITIHAYPNRITNQNAIKIISDYHIIVDCTDNFETRYMINDACVILEKPLVYGAIHTFEGQVSVFNYNGSANYRCLFPTPPSPLSIPSCNEIGVIGTLPGIIGSYQANEVIKCVLGLGNILANQLLTINTLTHQNQLFTYQLTTALPDVPNDESTFIALDYNLHCGIRTVESPLSLEVKFDDIKDLINHKDVLLIDVREAHERPLFDRGNTLSLPLSQLNENRTKIPKDKKVYIYCHSGIRSLNLVELLTDEYNYNNVKSISGGILRMMN